MRSGVPGNLPAAGPAPRLCPLGKQEEDGKGGQRGEAREDGMKEGEKGGTNSDVVKGQFINNSS